MKEPPFTWVTPIFCVQDLAASLDHYENVPGFDVHWKWSESNEFEETARPTFACVRRGEVNLFLCEQGQGHPGAWVMFNVNDRSEVEAIHGEYEESGANIIEVTVSWKHNGQNRDVTLKTMTLGGGT